MRQFLALIVLTALALAGPVSAAAADDDVVNVYSAREEALIQPLLERFTEDTGIEVNLVTGSADALIQRLQIEGGDTPADLLLAVDAARLHRAREAGLFRPVSSKRLQSRIPPHLRHEDGEWFALSKRARVIAYDRWNVTRADLSTYEDLADERWRDSICIDSSDNIHNQSLLASMIAAHGSGDAIQWARGLVKNMARRPQGGDRDALRAIAVGVCGIAVINTRDYARMQASKDAEARTVTDRVALFFPNGEGRGTHINVSGAGVTRHAGHPEMAIRLLEYLTGDDAQRQYAGADYEYPVVADVGVNETMRDWGYPFRQDELPLQRLAELNVEATRIFDRVGWQ